MDTKATMAMIAARVRFGAALVAPARAVPVRCFAADQDTHPEGLTHRISTYVMPQVRTCRPRLRPRRYHRGARRASRATRAFAS